GWAVGRQKELAMDLKAVGGGKNHRPWDDHAPHGKTGRNGSGVEIARFGSDADSGSRGALCLGSGERPRPGTPRGRRRGHRFPSPPVTGSGVPPVTATRHRCRRSRSPWFELKITEPPERATCSTSKAPGVSSVGLPEAASRDTDIEYRCVQPSRSQGNTSRSP